MAGQEIHEYAKVLGIFFTYIFPLHLITMNLVNTVEVYSLHLHNKLTLKQSGELSLPQRGSAVLPPVRSTAPMPLLVTLMRNIW